MKPSRDMMPDVKRKYDQAQALRSDASSLIISIVCSCPLQVLFEMRPRNMTSDQSDLVFFY